MIIRTCGQEDGPTMRQIEKEATGEVRATRAIEDFLEPICNYGLIAEIRGVPIGYMIYARGKKKQLTALMHTAVLPAFQRRGVATKLLDRVKRHAHWFDRWIVAITNEHNVVSQCWLRSNDFEYTKTLKTYGQNDNYAFIWKPEKVEAASDIMSEEAA